MRRGVVTIMALAVLAGACNEAAPAAPTRGTEDASTTTTATEVVPYPPDQVILRVDTAGGLLWGSASSETNLPEFMLLGDGRFIVSRDDPSDSSTVLPLVFQLSADGVALMVDAAEAAGLADPLEDYDPGFYFTDAATTTFNLHTTGPATTAAVYGLGVVEMLSEDLELPVDSEVIEARRKLVEFHVLLHDLEAWLGEDVIEGPDRYPIGTMAAYLALAEDTFLGLSMRLSRSSTGQSTMPMARPSQAAPTAAACSSRATTSKRCSRCLSGPIGAPSG